jgi:valyl-tRNA synthetase
MIMLGLELTGDVPFREVHIHGLVRDADKQKMSKTKGNVIDPLVIIDKYGTDAVRIALLVSAAAGADIALKEDRMQAGRMFANKLWNASRLLFMNMERSGVDSWTPSFTAFETVAENTEDAWIFERLCKATEAVNRALEIHRYHEAAQTLWDFVWHEFCDWYLEVKKLRFREGSGLDAHWRAALTAYESMLRLLHPFMPFVTEELWQRLVHGSSVRSGQPVSISLASFPVAVGGPAQDERVRLFGLLQQIVTAARELRADHKLEPKTIVDSTVYLRDALFDQADLAAAGALAKIRIEQRSGTISDHAGLIRSTPDFDLQLHSSGAATQNGAASAESRARILREIAALEKAIGNSERQLGDTTFLSKAPERIVGNMRAKLAEYQEQLAANRRLLEKFPPQ